MRALPSPTALRMFVEAAERESFAGAADALNVTQAAVSKQMASLEDRLETALFSRRHRSVVVTAAGRAYLPVARRVLALLEAGLNEASGLSARRAITVEVDIEFLDLVLAPRLLRLQAEIPDTDVIFVPTIPGRHKPQSDLAITYGHPRADAASVERLCGFTVFPVVSPLLLETSAKPFETLCLLHDVDTYWWDTFLRAQKVLRYDQGFVLGSGALAIRAALAGQGIAIGDNVLCCDALQRGDLVQIGTATFPGRDDYWISEHPNMQGDPVTALLRNWLKAETAQTIGRTQHARVS